MSEVISVATLVLVVALVAGLARRVQLAAPILLVVAGVLLSLLPGVPEYQLKPEIVLVFFLPPLVYAAAWQSSLSAIRANLRPIGLLSIGLVLFTIAVVGLVSYAVIPGLPLPAAFALGAIVAPTDAVAATAVGRRTGLPRRVLTILEGESLLNDATALVALQVARAAVIGGSFSVLDAGWRFALAAVGGACIGFAVAWIAERLHRKIADPLLDVPLTFLTPFGAFVAAEEVHASGVLAVVITGLVLGHRSDRFLSPASRLESTAVWRLVQFLLEGTVFLLIGLQMRGIVASLQGDASTVAWVTAAVLGSVVVARFVWVFPSIYATRLLGRRGSREKGPPWQYPFVLSWAGMRGVVSLAAAFALPFDFPQRPLLLFLALAVIVGTLLLQGLSLPTVIRRLGLPAPDPSKDALQEASAQHRAATAALGRLDEVLSQDGEVAPGVADLLRAGVEKRRNFAWERLGGNRSAESPSQSYRRLRHEMLSAEREVVVSLRDEGQLEESVLDRIRRDLDLEESLLDRN